MHLNKEWFHLCPINWVCEGMKKKRQECPEDTSGKDEMILINNKKYWNELL